jgi:GT2 family glycosyltransferase
VTPSVPATVVVPTIGRPALLRNALRSLAACRPRPAEVVVVDQSGGDAVRRVVEEFTADGVRRVACTGRGIGRAVNAGIHAASHDLLFITNDDCTVDADWIEVGRRELAERPGGIATGQVLPAGDAANVPSLNPLDRRHDHTGSVDCWALFAANMVTSRSALLDIGAFDERVVPTAEDNDLCYRWLRAGRSLQSVPGLRVWHHDWRTPAQMRELHLGYGRGEGVFFAKHLRAGDLTVLRFLARELWWLVREAGRAARAGGRPPGLARATLRGLAVGLGSGWRRFPGRETP